MNYIVNTIERSIDTVPVAQIADEKWHMRVIKKDLCHPLFIHLITQKDL